MLGEAALRPETIRFVCPACGRSALDFTHGPHRDGGWTVKVHCLGCGEGLDAVAAATGIGRARLLTWPPPDELGQPVGHSHRRRDGEEPPPSEGKVGGWHSGLLANQEALRYLHEKRGLLLSTIVEYELGYSTDRHAIVIPVRGEDGTWHTAKFRSLHPAAKRGKRGLARPSCLYPLQILGAEPQALVLCEGEFDALLLNAAGLPALTSTTGTNWKPEWNRHVCGRQVAVLYDVGSYDLANRRASDLRAAGAREAWPVGLPLARGQDVTDFFVRYQRPADDLKNIINQFRRLSRRERSAS